MKKEKLAFCDPFLNILPKLDLHGETSDTIQALILDFINVNLKMGYYKIQIVHGRHGSVLKKETHRILSQNKKVKNYHIYNLNDGVTIVELNKD